jgi:guanylate kinase
MKNASSQKPTPHVKDSGCLFVVSAPSGAGKTTLCGKIRKKFPKLRYSISFTTRNPRTGEVDGRDYYFIDKKAFERGIADRQWAEWAMVHGNYYGTSIAFIDKELTAGHDILLDIDVQGALQVLERYPDAITLFIEPPTLDILRKRLESRNTDSQPEIERRLAEAGNELSKKNRYRYVIINDQLDTAVKSLAAIIATHRSDTGKV